ncbi:hypothetical protein PAXINDRAFT_104021 [Paxillus involutus ATCC 200175]|uniref:Uncharacterized protein n=1 Tax=Paxillus involutus ATCC 200175 TaxID=664439 RepID=A0A0C9T026_PAXIN|nr:hypothetical protein PAXINDRAFT_104021 [Paxillus involutus ATCC 200175]
MFLLPTQPHRWSDQEKRTFLTRWKKPPNSPQPGSSTESSIISLPHTPPHALPPPSP